MNILPHKSWHVRTKKNIERVRRDEAKAAEEEEERQRRIALAEQETRTELLREKAKSQRAIQGLDISGTDVDHVTLEAPAPTHINFFAEIEKEERQNRAKNAEHEAEKKAEKEKWERKIGLLTYLGESSVESQVTPPWYLQNKKLRLDQEAKVTETKKEKRDNDDPLLKMRAYLNKKDKKHKKDKDEKKRHRKKEKCNKLSSSSCVSVDQLRAERLQREKNERSRALALMAKLQGEEIPSQSDKESKLSDRDRQYNSQFNPSLARQRTDKRHYKR